jgi:hypothetical protein
MRINLEIEQVDGTKQEVTASAIDLVKFEERYDISVSRLDKEMKLTHLLFLAHSSLKRQKKTDLDFEAWVETVESVGASAKDPK